MQCAAVHPAAAEWVSQSVPASPSRVPSSAAHPHRRQDWWLQLSRKNVLGVRASGRSGDAHTHVLGQITSCWCCDDQRLAASQRAGTRMQPVTATAAAAVPLPPCRPVRRPRPTPQQPHQGMDWLTAGRCSRHLSPVGEPPRRPTRHVERAGGDAGRRPAAGAHLRPHLRPCQLRCAGTALRPHTHAHLFCPPLL